MSSLKSTLRSFLDMSSFLENGAVMTDLDGTALTELDGSIEIDDAVVRGLRHLRRPIILNTLRFPANVIRACGLEFHAIQDRAVPLVSLNGGIGGLIHVSTNGTLGFEEVFSQPLSAQEIDAALDVDLENPDLQLFFHPRAWSQGETLWTPDATRINSLRQRFPHADRVISSSPKKLREELASQDICMILIPSGTLPIYQQQNRRDFITGNDADKLSGAHRMVEALGLDLSASIGAGDTLMDVFLQGCGLAIRVNAPSLPYVGLNATLDVQSPAAFGASLVELATLLDTKFS